MTARGSASWVQRPGRRALRLTDETIEGKRRPTSWVGMTIAGALAIDRGLAALGLSRPILVVSGFWRSGTTWLQECFAEGLGAKTVFEPVSPMEPRRRAMLGDAFATEDALQAFVPGPDQDAAFWNCFEAAASGRTGSRFSLSCRRSLWESFRTGIVVKDVRLHRNLRAVHERLDVPVVHVRRHPCAVVASLRAANWHWSFDRLSLLDGPLPQANPGFLCACDGDALSRLAAFWALHEREAALALQGQPWACEMTYEAMVSSPRRQIETAGQKLGLRLAPGTRTERSSASLDPKAFASVVTRRADFWTMVLTPPEIARIEHIVSTIYPEWRTHWAA